MKETSFGGFGIPDDLHADAAHDDRVDAHVIGRVQVGPDGVRSIKAEHVLNPDDDDFDSKYNSAWEKAEKEGFKATTSDTAMGSVDVVKGGDKIANAITKFSKKASSY